MITYFKNQRDLATSIASSIDAYWNQKMSESELTEYIKQVVQNNSEKLYKDHEFTSVAKQRIGKKRLELLCKIIKVEEHQK